MILTLTRYNDRGLSTLGALFIDNEFECYTLEDAYRDVKVKHETRIPSGTYDILLRNEGGMNERYKNHVSNKIRSMHNGMLWLQNVPNFKYIYIHIGNYIKDTSGCILVGKGYDTLYANSNITHSTDAYIPLYRKVTTAMYNGEDVKIRILDVDRQFK